MTNNNNLDFDIKSKIKSGEALKGFKDDPNYFFINNTKKDYKNYNFFYLDELKNKKIDILFKFSLLYNFSINPYHSYNYLNNLIIENCLFDGNAIFTNEYSIINNIYVIFNNSNINTEGDNDITSSVKFINYQVKNIHIVNERLESIKFNRINFYNNIISIYTLISNIEISELILDDIKANFESFEIRNCKIDKLIIRNSNLGKAVFNGVEIGKLEIENVTLNDCIFNGVDFKTYELEEIKNGDSINYKCMKDNYRQLKHVMDKNMNYTDANEFYALEMLYYTKYINKLDYFTFKSAIKNLYNSNTDKFGEKVILNISYMINKFGTDISINLFFIGYYLLIAYAISFFTNMIANLGITFNYNNIELFHILGIILLIFILFGYIYILEKTYKYIDNLRHHSIMNTYGGYIGIVTLFVGILAITLLSKYIFHLEHNNDIHFQGIKTFIYLLNPFSGLTDNSMLKLYWTEQLGMIIHKIIYGILIYQLIIALKRTTKR